MKARLLLCAVSVLVGLMLVCVNSSCGSRSDKLPEGLAGFDVGPEGAIVYAYKKEHTPALYTLSLEKPIPRALLRGEKGQDFFTPSFSKGGTMVAFVRRREDGGSSDICLLALDTASLSLLLSTNKTVTGIDFLPSDKGIRFVAAEGLGRSSPVAKERLHGFDLYEVDLATKNLEKLTVLNAYEMRGLSVIDQNRTLLNIVSAEADGLFTHDKTRHPTLMRLDMNRQPNDDLGLYYGIDYSAKLDKVCFSSPGYLHMVDADGIVRTFHTVVDGFNPNFMRFYEPLNRVIFSRWGEDIALSVDLDGQRLKQIRFAPTEDQNRTIQP